MFELLVDDKIYTQILYVWLLRIAGGTHDVLYAATSNNTVYAFDADAQSFQLVSNSVRPNATHHMHNTVVTWEGPDGLSMYASGENDYLHRCH